MRAHRRLWLIALLTLQAPDLAAQNQPHQRIVYERPKAYSFRYYANPITWIEEGIKPLFSLADDVAPLSNSAIAPKAVTPSKPRGVKFQLKGASPKGMSDGSGYGPNITLYRSVKPVYTDVQFLYTFRHYGYYQFNSKFPFDPDDERRVHAEIYTAYRSRPSDRFFGVGNESPLWNETGVWTIHREASAGLQAPVGESWWAGAELLYRSIGVTAPRGNLRSAQDVFDGSVPGLLTGSEIGSALLSFRGDTRDRLYLPSSGGLYSFEASRNIGIGGDSDFEYWKYRVESQHSFPITSDKKKVITLRGTAETNQPSNGDIPFVDLVIIGSWDTLRGFANQRYYDNSAVTFSVEYRYAIYRAFDWAFFADTGQVGQEIGDFHWGGFHAGFGARLIVWFNKNLPASISAARSNEQWRFYFALRPRF